jgi:hypothetical protein
MHSSGPTSFTIALLVLLLVFAISFVVRWLNTNGVPRYSLRTVLIIVTMVCVALGAAVFVLR